MITTWVASIGCSIITEQEIIHQIGKIVEKQNCIMDIAQVREILREDLGKMHRGTKWIPFYNIYKTMQMVMVFSKETEKFLDYLSDIDVIQERREDPDHKIKYEAQLATLEEVFWELRGQDTWQEETTVLKNIEQTIEDLTLQSVEYPQHFNRLADVLVEYEKMKLECLETLHIVCHDGTLNVYIRGGEPMSTHGIQLKGNSGVLEIDEENLGIRRNLHLTLNKDRSYHIYVSVAKGNIVMKDIHPQSLDLETLDGKVELSNIPVTDTTIVQNEDTILSVDSKPLQLKLKRQSHRLTYTNSSQDTQK